MNWGYKILITVIAFITMMLGFVYVAAKQDNPVIDKNYYERELQYQKLIDGSKNYEALSTKLIISNTAQEIIIVLPKLADDKIISGKIEILNVQKTEFDKVITINNDSLLRISIPRQELHSGRYLIRTSFETGSKFYYTEEKLNL